ncbi:MAG: glycosyltransferase [Acidobacteria bacterium]|nr:glycosyltransferase [Acidobacteriota bacterium]
MSPGPASPRTGATGGRRVALVHDWLTGMRGGEMVLEAMASLFPGAPIHTLFHFPGSVSPTLEAHPIHTSFLQHAPFLEKHYRGYLPLFPAAVEDLDLSEAELVLSSSHCVAKGIIPPPGAEHVCYCHTPMRYAWDQERAYFPRRRGLTARVRGLALSALRAWDVGASQRVDRFLANSSFVARRIERYYRRDAEVLAPPVDTAYYTPPENSPEGSSGPGEEYCLMVSALAPYKRVDLAAGACAAAGIELRVVGTGPERRRLESLAGPRTHFLGRVGQEELRELYRGARFLLQPGVEDFGIAPVEALACGTPVVALGEGGVLDIVESGTHGILYPDSDSMGAIQQAIDMASKIRFNTLDLRRRAERFSVPNFLDRLRSLLGLSSPDDPGGVHGPDHPKEAHP